MIEQPGHGFDMVRALLVVTRKDPAGAPAFAARGKGKAPIKLQPLSAVNDVLDRLQHGDMASRAGVDFFSPESQSA